MNTTPIPQTELDRYHALLDETEALLKAQGFTVERPQPSPGFEETYIARYGHRLHVARATDPNRTIRILRITHQRHGLMVEVNWGWSRHSQVRRMLSKWTAKRLAAFVTEKHAELEAYAQRRKADATAQAQVEAEATAALGFNPREGWSSDLDLFPQRGEDGSIEIAVRIKQTLRLKPDELLALMAKYNLKAPKVVEATNG